MNSYIKIALWIIATTFLIYAVNKSKWTINLGVFGKIILSAIIVIFMGVIGSYPIKEQWKTDNKILINPKQPTAKEIAEEIAKKLTPMPVKSTPKTAIPSPEIKLVFKNSTLLTPARKNKITVELNAFRNYLVGLGFEVPKETRPMGIGKGKGWTSGFNSSSDPVMSGDIYIGEEEIDDLSTWRKAYAYYVFYKIFNTNNANIDLDSIRTWCSFIFTDYFTNSFANQLPKDSKGINIWVSALWDIRTSCSQDFTDRSLFYTYKGIIQDREKKEFQIRDEEFVKVFNKFFSIHYFQGSWVLDNNSQNRHKIVKILRKHKLIE